MRGESATKKSIVERVALIVPGFNETQLGLDALYYHCDRLGYCAQEGHLRKLHGCSFYDSEGPCLVVNSLISPAERAIAGWHEFAHLTFDMKDARVFFSHGRFFSRRKIERKAQMVGVLAWMPDGECWGFTVPELIERYDVPRGVAEFRVSLMIP